MDLLRTRVYPVLEIGTNIVLLNLLWLAASLPLLTAYPATAALFGVVRHWVRQEDPGVIAPFFRHFRENLRQSLLLGPAWTFLGVALALNLLAIRQLPTVLAVPLLALAGTVTLVYLLTTTYLFPVMVSFHATSVSVVRNALFLALGQPALSLLALGFLALVLLVTAVVPAALLCSGGLAAYGVSAIYQRALRKAVPTGAESDDDPKR